MRQSSRTTLALILGATLAPAAFAAGPPAANASTSLTITPTPVALGNSPAADAVADTLTTSPSVSTATIDEGKLTVQMATLGGLPVTTATAGFTWTALPPGNITPNGGATATPLDFDGLGFVDGTVASFRAHYVTGGGQTHADTHFSPAIDVGAVADTCHGFNISADFASGEGAPPPNSDGPWAFRITLENCTGVNLTGIKAQGGSNGWAPMVGQPVPSKGAVALRYNNRNQVLTWNLDMPSGTTETLLVTVNGHIPASAVCNSIRYLSGPWSAVYNPGTGAVKSEYTGRVSIQVTCPLLKATPVGSAVLVE
jgi:hypothetical protein